MSMQQRMISVRRRRRGGIRRWSRPSKGIRGCRLPSPAWKMLPISKPYFFADFGDAPQSFGKFGARDHAVHACSRSARCGRPRQKRSCGPSRADRARRRHVRRALRRHGAARQMSATSCGCGFDGFAQPVDIDQQDSGRIDRVSGMDIILDGANGPAVEHFASRGRDPAAP